MFRRGPDTRRSCPVCGKRVNDEEIRYCNHCGEDFTGDVSPPTLTDASGHAGSIIGYLTRLRGRYVAMNFHDPEKAATVLLAEVKNDYFTISTRWVLVHLPSSAVVNIIERQKGLPQVAIRHEYIPKAGAAMAVGFVVGTD